MFHVLKQTRVVGFPAAGIEPSAATMMMSRSTATGGKVAAPRKGKGGAAAEEKMVDKVAEYLKARDFTGALATLEFRRKTGEVEDPQKAFLWAGYCAFHLGQFQRAFDSYSELLNGASRDAPAPPEVHLYQACCLFYLQMFKPCEDAAQAYTDAEQVRTGRRDSLVVGRAVLREMDAPPVAAAVMVSWL